MVVRELPGRVGQHAPATGRGALKALEQFCELRDARNGTPHHSILSCGAVPVCFAALQVRPAQCFALALCELSQSARQKDVASFCQML
ncbi:hypothetical protein DVJ83_05415 [Deinococcus wulumuqiensis]|uniref:Uncharacterized protein n=1 Tax=Deinococcus wulumuqiensis TaxID=980427 RepID=A0A345IG69_9DEIO|nr:hypothetical protein DVJ83_05415 [Deinococcus wulumuqiensis]